MKKYEQYQYTNIFWLRKVPIHWNIRKIKYSVKCIGSGTTPITSNSIYYNGNIPWIQSGDLYKKEFIDVTAKEITDIALNECSALKLYNPPFLVTAMYGASIGNTVISNIVACVNQACCAFVPIEDIYIKFMFYWMKVCQADLINQAEGGSQPNISQKKIKEECFVVPPRPEQDQIVRFLDWKISKINRLIEVKEKQIKELGELKKTIVNDAVTHGLHPDVPMKDSGVDWLGKIPAHWTRTKLRKILRPFSEKNHPELPLLSVVREQGVVVRDIEDKESNHNFIPDDLSGYKMVKRGQFAMNKMKAWQGSYGVSDYTGIVSPAYFIFDVDFANLEYFHYAIRSKVYVNFFAQASDGIRVGQWDLSMQKMKEIPFIIPPKEEQEEIVVYIPKAFEKYEKAIHALEQEIALLHELKASLISDAITGQIDVRKMEIPDYEYIDDELGAELRGDFYRKIGSEVNEE